jgi:hypothetical protein
LPTPGMPVTTITGTAVADPRVRTASIAGCALCSFSQASSSARPVKEVRWRLIETLLHGAVHDLETRIQSVGFVDGDPHG